MLLSLKCPRAAFGTEATWHETAHVINNKCFYFSIVGWLHPNCFSGIIIAPFNLLLQMFQVEWISSKITTIPYLKQSSAKQSILPAVFLHKCIYFCYVSFVEPMLLNWFYGYMINIVRMKKIYITHSAYLFQFSKKQSFQHTYNLLLPWIFICRCYCCKWELDMGIKNKLFPLGADVNTSV